jgi:hypothetical protein
MSRVVKELETEIIGIFDQFDGVTAEVCVEALKPTLEKSKEYCPKDTGELVGSAYLEHTPYRQHRGTGMRVEMGYAKDGHPDYAPYVHERLDVRHAPPTQAKFLERAVLEDLGGIYFRIAFQYRMFMGGAGV